MSRLPANLRRARIAAGLKQLELARKAQITPSSISHYESGRKEPYLSTARRLARVLGLTLDELAGT